MFCVPRSILLTAGLATLALAPAALAGPDWIEIGDAGSGVGTAQVPIRVSGVTFLRSISGNLASGYGASDYEDLYVIRVTDAAGFSIAPVAADFNPVLYLFNITVNNEALGLIANDDATEESNLPLLVQMSTDSTGVQVSTPGDYILAVTGLGRVPVSRTGPMFSFATPTEISGPDGPGGLNPLMGWTGEGETGQYALMFEDIDYPDFPAPGAAAGMVMGTLFLARRRRPAAN